MRMTPVALFSLLVASAAYGQPSTKDLIVDPRAPRTPVKAEIHYVSKQALGKGVTLARLSNGMTVIVQENHAAPVATVRSFVANTGSAYEGKFLGMGISHVLEHLVAGGSNRKRTETEIREILDTLGGQTNAYTSNDITAYYIDCPAKRVAIAIELVADSMQYASFAENEYAREMGVVQRELEMGEADPSRVMYQAIKSLIFTEHPMRHPTIGYLSVLQKIKRDDVLEFYKDRYVPQNMVFVVVGDVATDKVLSQVLSNFKDFQRTTERQAILPAEPDQVSPRSVRIEMEGASARFSMAWPTVALQSPELYPLDVISFILTNGDSSRLVRRLKIDKPLVISVSSSSYTPGFVKGWFQISVECKPENLPEIRKIIDEEIERIKKEPVSDAELAKIKRQVAAQHVFSQQTVEAQAGSLASNYLSTGNPLFDDQYVAGIQTVTAPQIEAAAIKYFVPERLNTALIEPIGSSKTSVAQKESQAADSPVIKKELANGLTVLLKRNAVLPMVTVQAFVKGGALSDTDKDSGLASLATEIMDKGTRKYTGLQIAEHFDSIGGSLGVDSQRNTSFLQASVLKQDLDTTLDYAYQVLFEPTFPEEEFAKAKQIRLARIAARSANAQSEIMDFWAHQLPSTSAYSRTVLGETDTVTKLTDADCKKFHQSYFVPNNMVLAVFGDIDPEAVLKQLEASFGKVAKSDSFEWTKYPESGSLPSSTVKHLTNQKKNTAMLVLGYPTVNIYDEKTRSALDLLSAVLTGGSGAGGRLHEELRGEQLVYYVFGFEVTGFAPGYYTFMAQTRPESLKEVVERIQANVAKVAKEGIPADELKKAKEKMIAAHAMQNTTPGEQAFQSAVNELYGLGYDYDKSYDERISKVTSEDIAAVVKKHFANYVLVTSSPEPAPALSNAASGQTK